MRFLSIVAIVASAAALSGQGRAAKTLDIYVVDVEGGNATLFVWNMDTTVVSTGSAAPESCVGLSTI